MRQGIPFRNAHSISGRCVALADATGRELWELTDKEFHTISPALTPEVRAVLSAKGSVTSRNGVGGTAPERVAEQLLEAKQLAECFRAE